MAPVTNPPMWAQKAVPPGSPIRTNAPTICRVSQIAVTQATDKASFGATCQVFGRFVVDRVEQEECQAGKPEEARKIQRLRREYEDG